MRGALPTLPPFTYPLLQTHELNVLTMAVWQEPVSVYQFGKERKACPDQDSRFSIALYVVSGNQLKTFISKILYVSCSGQV